VFFPRVNGVSTSIQTLRDSLSAAGVDSVLIAPRYAGEADTADLWRVAGRSVPRDPEDRLMHAAALRERLARIQRGEFDLVHIHTPFLAHVQGMRLARRLGIPCVETYHTLFEEYFYHYLPFLPRGWLKALARTISRRECNAVDCVVAPSTPMANALAGYGVTTPIRVLPTGLPESEFSPCAGAAFRARLGIDETQPVMVFVGRVAFEKNIGFLLEVAAHLHPALPDLKFIIAGEGPAKVSLERKTAQLGLNKVVHFVGYLDRQKTLPDCYCAGDVFVFASRTETQGLVLLEAMARGVAVVALAEMGTRDVLKEGEGCRIAPHDVAGFSAILHPLLRDRAAARALGERGKIYATGWSAQAMGEKMSALYTELITQKK
jgi:glycosyltransferase involved in cell wall biosynthesis